MQAYIALAPIPLLLPFFKKWLDIKILAGDDAYHNDMKIHQLILVDQCAIKRHNSREDESLGFSF